MVEVGDGPVVGVAEEGTGQLALILGEHFDHLILMAIAEEYREVDQVWATCDAAAESEVEHEARRADAVSQNLANDGANEIRHQFLVPLPTVFIHPIDDVLRGHCRRLVDGCWILNF